MKTITEKNKRSFILEQALHRVLTNKRSSKSLRTFLNPTRKTHFDLPPKKTVDNAKQKITIKYNLVNRICQDGDGATRHQHVRHTRYLHHFFLSPIHPISKSIQSNHSYEKRIYRKALFVSGRSRVVGAAGPHRPKAVHPGRLWCWRLLLKSSWRSGTTGRGEREFNTGRLVAAASQSFVDANVSLSGRRNRCWVMLLL